jgi:tRNA (Thr-GGU) A37 N-methylase
VLRSPYTERFGTPRQPPIREQVKGDALLPARIELLPRARAGPRRASPSSTGSGASSCSTSTAATASAVRSPRDSEGEHGLFATRSPHRPNLIGLSCLRLTGIEGRVLHVLGVDILDHTPVLDIKPYVPYADAFPEARAGWLDERVPAEPDYYEEPQR